METVLSIANSGLAVVVVIGLCLFFHETGHFLAAKACRMAVYEFAMGFGPVLWRRKRGETDYSIRMIPFGGFVRIAGMEPGETSVERGFHTRPRWQGMIVVCAGTFMNVVLAVLLYWGINVISGVAVPESSTIIVRDVFDESPAEAGGMQPGDRIIGVAGEKQSTEIVTVSAGSLGEKMGFTAGSRVFQVGDKPVATPGDVLRDLQAGLKKTQKVWVINGEAKGIEDAVLGLEPPPASALAALPEEIEGEAGEALAVKALGVEFGPMDQFALQRAISGRPGQLTSVTVLRGDATVALQVTPAPETARVEMVSATGKLVTPHRRVGRVGIVMGPELRHAGVIEGLQMAVRQSVGAVVTVVMGLKGMIIGKIGAEGAGPIGIMAMSAETAKLGWAAVLSLCALISANLAVINMAPIPPFDGFSAVLLTIEAALRRRVNQRLEMVVRIAGIVLILNLFLLLAFKDVMNLIRYGTY